MSLSTLLFLLSCALLVDRFPQVCAMQSEDVTKVHEETALPRHSSANVGSVALTFLLFFFFLLGTGLICYGLCHNLRFVVYRMCRNIPCCRMRYERSRELRRMRRLDQLHRERSRARFELERMMGITDTTSGWVDGTNDSNNSSGGEQGTEAIPRENLHPFMLAWVDGFGFGIVPPGTGAPNDNSNRPREWTSEERRKMLEVVVECQPYPNLGLKSCDNPKDVSFYKKQDPDQSSLVNENEEKQNEDFLKHNHNDYEEEANGDHRTLEKSGDREEAGTSIQNTIAAPLFDGDDGSSEQYILDRSNEFIVNKIQKHKLKEENGNAAIANNDCCSSGSIIGSDDGACNHIEKIPSDILHRGGIMEEEDFDISCSICLGEFEIGELLNSPRKCPHVFHKECLFLWLEKHDICPFCRTILVTPAELENASAQLFNTTANDSDDIVSGNSTYDEAGALVASPIANNEENTTSIIMEEGNGNEEEQHSTGSNNASVDPNEINAPQSEIELQSRSQAVINNEDEQEDNVTRNV
eukprot:CAMPEP_0195511130 /NCGR_PEP_ID=MMETSP0794_2-20130614/3563_1 /TAXON_ID=515487 /ORGANISM="Stephanopyxis turris, Strain CCMP 815" /LENGTH=525 /DNA_ID=CAMNT_0040638679 /DNA_START=22 /DNA_END=1599 /DNA_ORIENTATION=+